MSNRRGEIIKGILLAVGAVGLITVSVALPGLPAAFAPFFKNKRYTKQQVKRSLRKLEKNKLISVKYKDDKIELRITKGGREKVLLYNLETLRIPSPKKWDGKFRIVIFDIPQQFKKNSSYFSKKLKDLGFYKLQKSVWAYPYPCEDEIDFLKEIYLVRPFVRMITAEEIDVKQDLLKKFNIPS